MMPGKTYARYYCDIVRVGDVIVRFENINALTRRAGECLRDDHSGGLVWVKVYVDVDNYKRIQVGNLPYICGKGPTGWYATPLWKSDRVDASMTLWFKDKPVARLTGVTPANVVHALRTAVSAGTLPLAKGETGIVRAVIGTGDDNKWFHDYAVKVGRWSGEVTVDYRWDSSTRYNEARR